MQTVGGKWSPQWSHRQTPRSGRHAADTQALSQRRRKGQCGQPGDQSRDRQTLERASIYGTMFLISQSAYPFRVATEEAALPRREDTKSL